MRKNHKLFREFRKFPALISATTAIIDMIPRFIVLPFQKLMRNILCQFDLRAVVAPLL
jgi:hypothetical protein